MSAEVARSYVLGLASHTSWSKAEILAMKISEIIWWCEGLPEEDK